MGACQYYIDVTGLPYLRSAIGSKAYITAVAVEFYDSLTGVSCLFIIESYLPTSARV